MTATAPHKKSDGKLPVIELFGPTIQGEGAVAGTVSHFIRFGGCSYRCRWCDSMYAVDPEEVKKNASWQTADEIMAKIGDLKPAEWVTLTGGDPAMWGLSDLVVELRRCGYKIAVETQGALYKSWLSAVQQLTLSPKPPSSGMMTNYSVLSEIINKTGFMTHNKVTFKVVVFDDDDYAYAKFVHKKFPYTPMYLSAGTAQPVAPMNEEQMADIILPRFRWLADKVLKDPTMCDVRIGMQQHCLIWGNRKGV